MNHTGRDELNERLKQLALVAQQQPPLTPLRQLALGQLVQAILNSGRLCRPQRGNFPQRYEEIYEEARQELLLYICQNIDRYDPQRADVMAWCNVLLERRFFKEAIPRILDKPGIQKMSLSELDNLAIPEQTPVFAEILKEHIELDPGNILKKTWIRDHPDVNFQALAKQRLEGKTWKEISEKFEIKIPTLTGFYYRCLERFASNLKNAIGII